MTVYTLKAVFAKSSRTLPKPYFTDKDARDAAVNLMLASPHIRAVAIKSSDSGVVEVNPGRAFDLRHVR